jgi:hypothetical protein
MGVLCQNTGGGASVVGVNHMGRVVLGRAATVESMAGVWCRRIAKKASASSPGAETSRSGLQGVGEYDATGRTLG